MKTNRKKTWLIRRRWIALIFFMISSGGAIAIAEMLEIYVRNISLNPAGRSICPKPRRSASTR